MATYYELSHSDGSVREYATEEAALYEVYSFVQRGEEHTAGELALSRATDSGRGTAIAEGQALIDRAIARFSQRRSA